MALIHEKLYESHDLSHIDFHAYATSLVHDLVSAQTLHHPHSTPKVRTEMDNVFLDVDTAIPCGLIINELIKDHLNQGLVLDFEGSMISGVANFYKSFGAVEENYYYFKKRF